jgi:hypothetical protein
MVIITIITFVITTRGGSGPDGSGLARTLC